jgi:hypothetical protein
MRVRISDPALLNDLMSYLRSADCVAEKADADALDVAVPRAPSDDQAAREVDIYLRAWQAMHPGVRANLFV